MLINMSYTFKQQNNRHYVYSKIIHFIEYDRESGLLKIGFNDGTTGLYHDFPHELYDEFEQSSSKGNFFYKKIHKAGFKAHMEPA